jgi:hypothetical protein
LTLFEEEKDSRAKYNRLALGQELCHLDELLHLFVCFFFYEHIKLIENPNNLE